MRGKVLGGRETGGFGLTVESDALIARTSSEGTAGLLATAATRRPGSGWSLEAGFAMQIRRGGCQPMPTCAVSSPTRTAATRSGVRRVRFATTRAAPRTSVRRSRSHTAWEGRPRVAWNRCLADTRRPALRRSTTSTPGAHLDAELGYGFSVLGGRSVAVPHVGVSRSTDGQTLRVGSRLRLDCLRPRRLQTPLHPRWQLPRERLARDCAAPARPHPAGLRLRATGTSMVQVSRAAGFRGTGPRTVIAHGAGFDPPGFS